MTTPRPSSDLVQNPETVAPIGTSENEVKSRGLFLDSFTNCGFKSELFLVNPRGGKIRGYKAYPKMLDIPREID